MEKETAEENGVMVQGELVSHEQAMEALNNATVGELDSGYLSFKPGDKKRVIFVGWKEIPSLGEDKTQMTKACVFKTDTGKEQINADAVVLSYFKRQQVGVARQITCKGEAQTSKGKYKTFEFHELNLAQ